MATYRLINPNINPNTEFVSNENKLELAAAEIWNKLSSHIKGYVPKFYFSIQNTKDGIISHFEVTETITNKKVTYKINQIDDMKISKFDDILVQQGGYHKSSSSHKNKDKIDISSSSSSSLSSSDSLSSSSDRHKKYKYKYGSNSTYGYNSLYPTTFTYYPAIYGVEDIIIPTFLRTFYGNSNPSLKIVLPTEYTVNF